LRGRTVPIQWRKLAKLALGRATQTEQPAEKVLLLDMAARYQELAERTEGGPPNPKQPDDKPRQLDEK
jgi:hypothetical protein